MRDLKWNPDEAWRISPAEVLAFLNVDVERGLSGDEHAGRLEQHGFNDLIETGQRSPWRILWEQVSGAMVLLLVAAAAVSLALHEVTDSVAILTIIVLNAILGFTQDYRAERALAALKQLAVPTVRVRRGGATVECSARELVPGDIVLLEAGNAVPADCRVLTTAALKTQESALTGESEPVEKTSAAIEGDHHVIADQTCMVWMGTIVTYGHGVVVVVRTGMRTQIGHIASSLQNVESGPTPLQQRLARMGRGLAVVALLIVGLVFGAGLLRGEDPRLMLMTALSLAVAVVPEGLPAVATVTLALGARRMYRRHALIRKLPAVETLGSVTVICSDKTGTLTLNRMTVTSLDVADERVDVAQPDPAASGVATSAVLDAPNQSQSLLLIAAALCNDATLNDATLNGSGEDVSRASSARSPATPQPFSQAAAPESAWASQSPETWQALGDPTETALVLVAARYGLRRSELELLLPRVAEVPFDAERRCMTTVHRLANQADVSADVRRLAAPLVDLDESDCVALTKGALDAVLGRCEFLWHGDEPVPLDAAWESRIRAANDDMAKRGMRVLSMALRPLDATPQPADLPTVEQELIFIGLIGMIDPPRLEARDAVARCRAAGIRPVMITGDHPLTALTIARQLGIATESSHAVTGHELAGRSVSDLESLVDDVSVYARVAPRDKLHIVQALQNRGQVVAMTGDGVNDAPALKQAHIGVAMGITGSDVAKEAADIVLLDDNFATIVNAVEEGRIVYDNIRKFVKYTMTSNAGETGVMVLGPLLGMPLPLLPLQILWINLVTDGLPGLALAVEPAERNTMQRPPVPQNDHIFGRQMVIDIAWIGLLMAVISLAMGYMFWSAEIGSSSHWRTMVFTVLTLSQMGNALAIRSDVDSLFRLGIGSNRALIAAIALTFFGQLAVIYIPAMQTVFRTTALSLFELLICIALSTVVFFAIELKKWLWRSRAARP